MMSENFTFFKVLCYANLFWVFVFLQLPPQPANQSFKLCNVHCPRLLKKQLVGNGAMFYDIIVSHPSWLMMVFGEIKAIPPILCIWASNNNISHIRDGRVLVSHSRWSISWWSSSCLTFKMVDFLSYIQDGRFLVSQVLPINMKIKTIKAKLWEMSNNKSVGPIIQSSQSRVGVKLCNPFFLASTRILCTKC
jgi:hypothetical protein